MPDVRGVDGIVLRFSARSGKGAIQLIDGRVVSFTAGAVRQSGIRDLKPGDTVTVELEESRGRVSTVGIGLRESPLPAREIRRRIQEAEGELNEGRDRPLKILLVGRTGVGKSSTINSLLGVRWATVGDHEPETAEIHSYEGRIDAAYVQVVDTPGFCDDHPDKGNDERYVREMEKYIGEIDLMLFVTTLDDTRVRADEIRALELLTKSFGEGIWDKAVVVFTRADLLRGSEYPTKLTGRFSAFRKRLREIASRTGSVPFVAVSNIKLKTPDRRLWLPVLWIACLERMSADGFEPFFLSTAGRLESASRPGGKRAAALSEPAGKATKRERSSPTRQVSGGGARKTPSPTLPAERKPAARLAPDTTRSRVKSERPSRAGAAASPPPASSRPAVRQPGSDHRPAVITNAAAPKQAPSSVPVETVSSPPAAVVDSTTRRRKGGVQIVETKLSMSEARGTIIVNGDQAQIVQQTIERKAPSLLRKLAKVGASLLPKLKRILGF